ncbi:hypothetical protein ACIP4S_13220 [Streptomyces chartreusis]|uniref:hypothetical protein n=1 Tax=Streptomyces chartreusis TaxID=1969 RepID=UPI0038302A7E
MTALAPELTQPGTDHGQDLDHVVCCDEDTALCGADVSGAVWGVGVPDATALCVVCRELAIKPCPNCGE